MSDLPASNGPEVRLLFLGTGDPSSERPFSGSMKSLALALSRRGVIHHQANVLGMINPYAAEPTVVRLMRRWDPLKTVERYSLSRFAFGRNSHRAERIAGEHPGFNAAFLYGTQLNPQLNVPIYCCLDATAARVSAAREWTYAFLSAPARQETVSYQSEVFTRCECVFARSRWTADSVRHDYNVPERRICIVTAGGNFRAPVPEHAGYDKKTILFVGGEFERKGGPMLVEAFRILRKTHSDARLCIVGCVPDVAEEGIEIVGWLDKQTVEGMSEFRRRFSEASVFCMLSRFEPVGNALVEAMSFGVPCVAPNRFAFSEILRDGETGRFVSDDDPQRLARTLGDMLSDPVELARMGKAAKARIEEYYTWDRAAEIIHNRIAGDLARQSELPPVVPAD